MNHGGNVLNNIQVALRLWNSLAMDYAEEKIADANTNFTMGLIERHGMCPPDARVLDVGCGAGKYAVALSKTGASVTATDFSENMIACAKERAAQHNANISFSHDDWDNVDITSKGWYKYYDFVLCSLNPAMCNEIALRKAVDICKGWLLITMPCRRTSDTITDKLCGRLGFDNEATKADQFIKLAFSLLYDMRFSPRLEYDEVCWDSKKPLDKALSYYTDRLESRCELNMHQKSIIKDYLTEIAEDGIVREKTDVMITAVFCKVR
jgi:SAM-dependent methyltransferase